MHHNRIRAVENFAFYNLDNLLELDMENNPLTRIAEYGWDYMRSLKRLRVSFGRYAQFYVTFIPTYGIEQLESLSISRAAPQFMAVIQTWLEETKSPPQSVSSSVFIAPIFQSRPS